MKPTKKQMIAAARNEYQKEGEIEVDNNAKISRATGNPDNGAFVQAWVWISDEEALNTTGTPATLIS